MSIDNTVIAGRNLILADLPQSAASLIDMPTPRTLEELAGIVQEFASSFQWLERVRLRADRRWYERLYDGPEYDVWLITWMPGQSTGFHDHGASSGAFLVTAGILEEHRPDGEGSVISKGDSRAFGPHYTHDVRNVSKAPSISIHAYSPPLTEMNEYELKGDRLIVRAREHRQSEIDDEHRQLQKGKTGAPTGVPSIDDMLAVARARLQRLSPRDAYEAVTKTQAVLLDIRPESQRAIEGYIDGALVVERNVLEWRLDPASHARLPVATSHDLHAIVFCSEGYASSLAAAALQELGLWRATDIVGGVRAWREEGLPISWPCVTHKRADNKASLQKGDKEDV